jgi:very-short-patch-repair endonuclease
MSLEALEIQEKKEVGFFLETSFTKEVAKYFMNFLETDFKKRRIPKRSTTQKSYKSRQLAFDLEKYTKLKQYIFSQINKGFPDNSFVIKKGQYTANIPEKLLDLIELNINDLTNEQLQKSIKDIELSLLASKNKFADDYDSFCDFNIEEAKKLIAENFVHPFLNTLDKPLENLGLADENSKYQVEIDIIDNIFSVVEAKFNTILRDFYASKNKVDLETWLGNFLPLEDLKDAIRVYFKNLSIADAYYDLNNIYRNNQLIDKTEIYLYFYEMSLEKDSFPLFYMPVKIEEDQSQMKINLDSRVYVNTKAIDFVIQEFNKQSENPNSLLGAFERILYLKGEGDFFPTIKSYINRLENFFEFKKNIDFEDSNVQKNSNLLVQISNKAYFYIFDKSDEALINDYEEIINGTGDLNEKFTDLLRSFIEDNPVSFIDEVCESWISKPIAEKLQVESPVPLNDEQKQIVSALAKNDCRFLVIEGPPGTGKSHTITAIICKALLEEKSVLVLSDKKEALDVVEDKISQTLDKVRLDEDFQNPILRLGKSGNKFNNIVSATAVAKIREHCYAFKQKKGELLDHKEEIAEEIQEDIEESLSSIKQISMDDIQFYCENSGKEFELTDQQKSIIANDDYNISVVERTRKEAEIALQALLFFDDNFKAADFKEMFLKQNIALGDLEKFESGVRHFINFVNSKKLPLFGFVFAKDDIDKELKALRHYFPKLFIERPEKNLRFFERLLEFFERFNSLEEEGADLVAAFNMIIKLDHSAISDSYKFFDECLNDQNFLTALKFHKVDEFLNENFYDNDYDHYVDQKSEIETIVTAEMAYFLDQRLLEYVNSFANDANNLKTIIKQKQKFPKDLFQNLKKAFPCILSGIRDYAEFIPLEKDLFDLIIIDEASQVSVAQALPALLRGKQVIVLGDDKQFSNVKSHNASKVINQQYKTRILEVFKTEMLNGVEDTYAWCEKVKKNFDVKNSILKFMKFIRNYECLLKKHFRCYPEIISYSDKYFYANSLQCMKIRGVPIDNVIKIDVIEHDNKIEKIKNTNNLEIDFIVSKLQELHDCNYEGSVGVISPHREQVQLIFDRLNTLSIKEWLFDSRKLKVMTFDTCQGEERDYIFYSMVATQEDDKLNYIFPKSFSNIVDEEDGSVKSQRLNVGFSRAKETIHFVLSKNIEEYSGEIRNALTHYANELESAKKQIIGGTDEKSPMEDKIQQYFYQTKFYKEYKDKIEFVPQFEIGKYLKQLDKSYEHRLYKVDFLLVFENQKIIIEYDGFKEHFTNREMVNQYNYRYYMKDEDIYREKVLESYGYKFIRINCFNIGDDPIETLDERLESLAKKKSLSMRF